MSENTKEIFTRIINKHDLEVNWLANGDFVPLNGELIIYDSEISADGAILDLPANRTVPYTYSRLKVGNGYNTINDLPFVNDTAFGMTLEELKNYVSLPAAEGVLF